MPVSKIMPLILSGTSSGFWATTCNPYKIVYVPVPVSIVVIFLLLVIFGFCLFPDMRILYQKNLGTNEKLLEFEVGDLLKALEVAGKEGQLMLKTRCSNEDVQIANLLPNLPG
jgi:hypothetical protein